MQAVILAGGLATRLGDITKNTPKSLVAIQGKPFLQYQLDFLRENDVKDIVLCIGHLGSQIQEVFGNGAKYGVNIQYSVEEKLMGTAGAIKQAEQLLQAEFFTLYGDSYFHLNFKDIMSFFLARQKTALMTVYRNYDLYDRSNTAIEGDIVTKYDKKNAAGDMVYIDYGLNVFRKNVLQLIPVSEHYGLEAVFVHLITQQELLAYEVKERFYEIGSVKGLRELNEFIRRNK